MLFEIKPFFLAVSAVVWKCMAKYKVLFALSYFETEKDSLLVEAAERLEIRHLREEKCHFGLVKLRLKGNA